MGFFNWFSKKEENNKTTTSQNIEEKYQSILTQLENHKKTAYLPVVENNPKSFSAHSKYGGYPYLRNENDWPICENCKLHMSLFLQLNLSELPIKKDEGLLQLFYCTNQEQDCESKLEAFFHFSKATVCRKINIENNSTEIEPNNITIFKEKRIVDWQPKDDYPHFEDYAIHDLLINLDEDIYDLLDERQAGQTIVDDKLFGWPYWVQGEEYPFDRKTNSQMELVFQIGESEHIPYMFGDAGIGHLTQSPDNDEELTFGWACY